jgi:hypothetical protein
MIRVSIGRRCGSEGGRALEMSQKPQGVGASNLALRRRPKAVSAVPRVLELLWDGFDSTARLHSPKSLSQW